MKKSTQFILAITIIIAVGIFWRISGAYITNKKRAETTTDMLSNNTDPKDTLTIKNILVGSWYIEEKTLDDYYLSSKVEFKPNDTFKLQTSIRYNNKESEILAGGTVKGTYEFIDSNHFKLNVISCHLATNSGENYDGLKFFENKLYGPIETDYCKSTMTIDKDLSKPKIDIYGYYYNSGKTTSIIFERSN